MPLKWSLVATVMVMILMSAMNNMLTLHFSGLSIRWFTLGVPIGCTGATISPILTPPLTILFGSSTCLSLPPRKPPRSTGSSADEDVRG